MNGDENDELPEGWTWGTIGDLISEGPANGYSGPVGEGGTPTLKLSATTAGRMILNEQTTKRLTDVIPPGSSLFLRLGDLLIQRANSLPYLGAAAIYDGPPDSLVYPDLMMRVRVPSDTTRSFLWRWLNSQVCRVYFRENATGTAGNMPKINGQILKRTPVPVPPLAEQRRIVAAVEAVLAKVNAARDRLNRVPSILKRFRQAVLSAACSGHLTADWREKKPSATSGGMANPEYPVGWDIRPLSELVIGLQQGWSPKCEIEASPSPSIWGVIKTTAVQPMRFLEVENKRLPTNLTPQEQLELQAGDILITRAGPRVRAGVTCLVRSTRPRLMICDKVYRFRPVAASVLGEFLEAVLNTPEMLDLIDALKTGISDSGVNLTQEKFGRLDVPLPPLAEQQEIMLRVGELFALADVVEARLTDARQMADQLTQAVLAKAFRGELVPTEAALARREKRPYEPAADLLARIRAEREQSAATVTKPTRTRKPKPAKE